MLKYSFRVFDKSTDALLISSIVPAEQIFTWLEKYSDLGVVKAYIIDSESEVK